MSTQTTDKKAVVDMSKDQSKAYAALTTTSARIRYLASIGISRSNIASFLGKRYQHVRNVLVQPQKANA
jgi:hypothetical protein